MPDTTQPDPSISTELIIPQEVLPSLNIDVEGLDRVLKAPISKVLETAKMTLDEEKSELQGAENIFKKHIRRVSRCLREVSTLENRLSSEIDCSSILKHLNGMITAGSYTHFGFDKSKVSGFTTDVIIKYQGTKYALGSLQVEIDMVRLRVKIYRYQNNPVSFKEHPESLNPHPHVDYDSDVCWGNVASNVPKMIEQGNIGGVFELAYDFLHHFNHGSEYRPIWNWPEVKEEKPKRVPKPRVSKQPAIPISSSNEQVVVDGEIGMVESVVMPMVAPVSDSTDLTIAIDNDIRIHGIDPYNLSLTEKIRVHESLERHERGSESYVRALA